MKLRQGDAVLIRGKIVSVDGNQATVSLSSTDFAIVPLSAIGKSAVEYEDFDKDRDCALTPEKNVPRGGKRG